VTVDVCQQAAAVELPGWVPWLLWGGLTVLLVALLVLIGLAVVSWVRVRQGRRARARRGRM
jgi:hypothetical protein